MITLLHGDSLKLLSEGALRHPETGKILKADASITDPPYNVSLDGDRDWDDFQSSKWVNSDEEFMKWTTSWARPLLMDICWPGSLIAAFSAHRTVHAVMFGLQKAGVDIVDVALWLYATGQVKHKMKLKPAYEPITIGRRRNPQGDSETQLNANFKKTGRGLLHTQDLKAEDGKHPLNVEIADPLLLELDDADIQDMAKFLYVPKPAVKDRDYGCEDLPIRKKEGNLSGVTLKCQGCGQGNFMKGTKTCQHCGGEVINVGISGASGEVRNFHPTVKPIALMRRLVRLLTKPGATVIDPFMGSGTTGIACILEGRSFIGIEREADFFNLCCHRMAHALREMNQPEEAEKLLARKVQA